MPISILILTKNSEHDLPECLETVRWSDDVYLLDSGSVDQTPLIAARFGAKIVQRKSGRKSDSLNSALNEIPFEYPWLLLLEPNERVTAGLEAELKLMVYHTGNEVAYRIRTQKSPQIRRSRPGKVDLGSLKYFNWDSVRFTGDDMPIPVADGPIGELEAPLRKSQATIDHTLITEGEHQSNTPQMGGGQRSDSLIELLLKLPWRISKKLTFFTTQH